MEQVEDTTTEQAAEIEQAEDKDTVITEQAAEIERLLEAMELTDEQLGMIQDTAIDILSALHITDHDQLVNEVRRLCCDILTTVRNG
jgi:CHAD domain-containing protein